MKQSLAGLGKKERAQFSLILKEGAAVITPKIAAKALGMSQSRAAQLLALWNKKGWLSRLKRGAYIPISLQADSTQVMADEPLILAKSLFSPCYIGGWSAAEHWDFTEQIFNSVMVLTSRKVLERDLNLNGARFQLKTIKADRLFGAKSVWIQNSKVEISDPSKTIVDVFNDPTIGGGIRMAVDILARYQRSEHKNLDLLFDYAKRMGNTAIFKRLGFVFEKKFPSEIEFIEKCRSSLKSGYSQLDPATPGNSLATSWKLWVPTAWKKGMPLSDHN